MLTHIVQNLSRNPVRAHHVRATERTITAKETGLIHQRNLTQIHQAPHRRKPPTQGLSQTRTHRRRQSQHRHRTTCLRPLPSGKHLHTSATQLGRDLRINRLTQLIRRQKLTQTCTVPHVAQTCQSVTGFSLLVLRQTTARRIRTHQLIQPARPHTTRLQRHTDRVEAALCRLQCLSGDLHRVPGARAHIATTARNSGSIIKLLSQEKHAALTSTFILEHGVLLQHTCLRHRRIASVIVPPRRRGSTPIVAFLHDGALNIQHLQQKLQG